LVVVGVVVVEDLVEVVEVEVLLPMKV